jgi:hypothetical protein
MAIKLASGMTGAQGLWIRAEDRPRNSDEHYAPGQCYAKVLPAYNV